MPLITYLKERVPFWFSYVPPPVQSQDMELSHHQIESLADLAWDLTDRRKLLLKQTYSRTGGTHLYVWHPVKRNGYHLSKNGKLQQVNGALDYKTGEIIDGT